MRDWGYGDEKAPFGDNGFIEKTPEALARWVGLDSTTLSKVTDDDLLDELKVRLCEYATLPAHELSERISDMLFHYDEVVERRK